MSIQLIEKDGSPVFAVLPYDEYQALMDRLEKLSDAEEAGRILAAIQSGEEETFPLEIIDKLLSDEAPARIWREYRGLTQQEVAEQVGVTKSALSMIENGKRQPSVDLLRKLAACFHCDLDDLMGPSRSDTVSRG